MTRPMVRFESHCPCGKANYSSRGVARAAARRVPSKGSKDPLHVYLCPVSKLWHVGHARGSDVRNKRRRW